MPKTADEGDSLLRERGYEAKSWQKRLLFRADEAAANPTEHHREFSPGGHRDQPRELPESDECTKCEVIR